MVSPAVSGWEAREQRGGTQVHTLSQLAPISENKGEGGRRRERELTREEEARRSGEGGGAGVEVGDRSEAGGGRRKGERAELWRWPELSHRSGGNKRKEKDGGGGKRKKKRERRE